MMDISNDSGFEVDEQEARAPPIQPHRRIFQPRRVFYPIPVDVEAVRAINPDDSMYGGVRLTARRERAAVQQNDRRNFANTWYLPVEYYDPAVVQKSEEVTESYQMEFASSDRVFRAIFPVAYPSLQLSASGRSMITTIPVAKGKRWLRLATPAQHKKHSKLYLFLVKIVSRIFGE